MPIFQFIRDLCESIKMHLEFFQTYLFHKTVEKSSVDEDRRVLIFDSLTQIFLLLWIFHSLTQIAESVFDKEYLRDE